MTPATVVAVLPWYRQRWPWLLMLGPAIVVVAGFVTLWLAITSFDGLVADDYYKRGLGINRTLERAERAAALGLVAIIDVDAGGAARVALSSTVVDLKAAPALLRLTLLHPTRAGADRRIDMQRGADGSYRGQAGILPPGRWRVGIETDDWRLPTVEIEGELRGVRITAEAPR